MKTSMCLKMLCQLLIMLTFCFLFANSTDAYDSDGRINGSGYENFSADDLRDINGGHDDAEPSTSNSQNVVPFEPEAMSSSNHVQTPPATLRDNQSTSGTYSNDEEYADELKKAMKQSEIDEYLRIQQQQKMMTLLRKSSEPKTKSDSSKPNLSRSKSMAHHGGTSSAKKVPHKGNKEAKKPTT
uniref:Secreted protein n=1 Tax=Globodera rostochiensis TaxID=31243 RepID=A0A914HMY8_GLORO